MLEAVLGTAGVPQVAKAIVKRAQRAAGPQKRGDRPSDQKALAVRHGRRPLARAAGHKKQAVMEALRGGSSFAQAALAARVSRATIYRWVQSDAEFRAAYNAWQQELLESSRARLVALTEQAVDAVAKALRREDHKIAFAMLRQLGVMRQPHTGSTDPQVAQLQLDLQKKREEHKALQAMAEHLLERAGLTPAERKQYLRECAQPKLGQEAPRRKLLGYEPRGHETEDETGDETSQASGQAGRRRRSRKSRPQRQMEQPLAEAAAGPPVEAPQAVSHDSAPDGNAQVPENKGVAA